MPATVLVTGVSHYLGARFAGELVKHPGVGRVIGVDVVAPTHHLSGAEFVRADIRNPAVGRLMSQASVDTVVHLAVSTSPPGGARVSQKEINVIGTMQLLAACQATESVRRIVLKSTGAVYGSSPKDPAMFTEEMSVRSSPRSGYVRDCLDVEGYVRGVGRRRPGVQVDILRMANIVGPHLGTAFTDYFRRPFVAVPLGYDARLQLLHEDDAVAALMLASTRPWASTARAAANGSPAPGVEVINVAADGVLTLTQAARIVGRPVLPVPVATGRLFGQLAQRASLTEVSGEQLDYLFWGRCLDTTRMRSVLGLNPTYTTREAFADFAHNLGEAFPGSRALGHWADSVVDSVIHRLDGPESMRRTVQGR
ncbi:MAG TPA: NAD-dependent epimerase/dehydratase family protein [Dermatophilaceae bacterium]|nr:NAD-dependent epimerase/dehydratase family protein [Dermatophilaceae bacterium]